MSRFCPQQKQGAAKFAHCIRRLRGQNLLIAFADFYLRKMRGSLRKLRRNAAGAKVKKVCEFCFEARVPADLVSLSCLALNLALKKQRKDRSIRLYVLLRTSFCFKKPRTIPKILP
uniref:Uncharacterized protein n=1 Tax=Tupiella akineta TaxID=160070 RepID=Q6UVQ6_TUPAK|nr:hypothetical protein PsakpMp55 [Tupiella akineta]AAQ18768.1 hypothetical protein [Tupiella akineta]